MSKRRFWTTVEIRKLREMYPNTDNRTISRELNRTRAAVLMMSAKLGLRKSAGFMNGPLCKFQRGHKTWNKGIHWNPLGSRSSQFKKGHIGARQKEVGAERRTRDGIEVKIEQPNKWESKARVVWERDVGPIPKGAIVRLKDGDWNNCIASNLMLISRAEHARLNYRPRRPKPIAAWISCLEARI